MKINGYDINYDEAELKDKMENQTLDVRLISPDLEGYKNLSEGNKKATILEVNHKNRAIEHLIS